MSQLTINSVAGQLRLKERWLDVGDDVYYLSERERDLMEYLMQHPNQVCSAKEIIEGAWGTGYTEDNVRVYIGKIRRNIENNPRSPRIVRTVQSGGMQGGGGYIIVTDERQEAVLVRDLQLLEGSKR